MFCKNCGSKINENTRFCTVCGAVLQTQQDAPASVPVPTPVINRNKSGKKRNKNGIRVLMFLVSILLILMGIGFMALTLVGRTATAHVTSYEQRYIINNDDSTRNPSRYKLDYQFAINGERYTGSVTRIFQGGSHMRQTIMVRYLPFWPHVNAEDSGGVSLAGPIMTGAGILLLVFEVKSKPRVKVDKLLYPK